MRKPPSLAMKRDCSHKGFARRRRNSADNHVSDLIFQCKYFTKNGNRAMLFPIAGASYGLAWRLDRWEKDREMRALDVRRTTPEASGEGGRFFYFFRL